MLDHLCSVESVTGCEHSPDHGLVKAWDVQDDIECSCNAHVLHDARGGGGAHDEQLPAFRRLLLQENQEHLGRAGASVRNNVCK